MPERVPGRAGHPIGVRRVFRAFQHLGLSVTLGLAAALLMLPPSAHAVPPVSIVVTVFTDAAAGGAAGTGAGTPGDLRKAILDANASGGAKIITFSGLLPQTITLNGPLPPITSDLTIDGGTLGDVVIDGANLYRVFFVDTGTATFSKLRIQNAKATGGLGGNLGGTSGGGGGGGAGVGAGLFVNQAAALVTVSNCQFFGISAVGGAGGAGGNNAYAGGGGGGLAFPGGSSPANGGGAGGGGVTGAGGNAPTSSGGAGGSGGGGGGCYFGSGTGGASGSAYATDSAGTAGGSNAGAGGFGGGGGGSALSTPGGGGFGGGGGGTGSSGTGASGGPGGGGGGSGSGSGISSGGSLGSNVSGGTGKRGGGGGAAAGPAIFVRNGTLTTANSFYSNAVATGGVGGSSYSGANFAGASGTADSTAVFNYNGTVNASGTLGPIADALLGIPLITSTLAASGTYGSALGTYTITATDSPTSYSATGLPNGLTVDPANGQITGTPVDSGTFNVTLGATNAGGSDSKTLVLTIAKAALTVVGVTADSKPYDGTPTATLNTTSASLSGVVNGDSLTLATGGASGVFDSSAVGSGNVTISGFTFGGGAAGNYTLTQPAATASITAAPVTVTATSGQLKIVGAGDPTFTYTVTSGALISPDAFSGALSRVPGETAGGYAITQGTLAASANYEVSFVAADFTVVALNVAPVFSSGGNVSAAQDAGPQTVPAWATGISPGPAEEAGQTVNFLVIVDNAALFATPPAIAPNGTLTFAPTANGSGTATVTVTLHDSGGTAHGGVNTSAPVTFEIAVTTYDEEPGTYNGLAQAAPHTVPDNAHTGLIKVTVGKKGVFTGSLKLADATFPLIGHFDKAGVARFGRANAPAFALPRKGQSALALTLQLDVSAGTDKMAGLITEASVPFAVIDADRALFTAAKSPRAPFMNPPEALLSYYTAALSIDDPTRPPSEFPQGDGVGILRITKGGMVRLVATLADGTPIFSTNALSKSHTWPLYANFGPGKGSISGQITFRDVADVSDLDSPRLDWFKAADAKAKRYVAGWPLGLRPTLVGSKFTRPGPNSVGSFLPGLAPVSATGNAEVVLADGNLPQPIAKSVNVTPANGVNVIAPGADKLVFSLRITGKGLNTQTDNELQPLVGVTEGSFLHPMTHARTTFRGVILQKQGLGTGFFLGATESGSVTISPK